MRLSLTSRVSLGSVSETLGHGGGGRGAPVAGHVPVRARPQCPVALVARLSRGDTDTLFVLLSPAGHFSRGRGCVGSVRRCACEARPRARQRPLPAFCPPGPGPSGVLTCLPQWRLSLLGIARALSGTAPWPDTRAEGSRAPEGAVTPGASCRMRVLCPGPLSPGSPGPSPKLGVPSPRTDPGLCLLSKMDIKLG